MSGSPRQQQFLEVVDRDEATRRFHAALRLEPLGTECVSLFESVGRVLATEVRSAADVTAFDRSNVDGFAVIAASTAGATEETPIELKLDSASVTPGMTPTHEVEPGTATTIATGGMVPRGANAIVMIEDTDVVEGRLCVTHVAAPGQNISYAGTDIAVGEVILRPKQRLTSREIGVLAATGQLTVEVFRKPRVAVISTGNEIVSPGDVLPPGCVFDSNQAILSAAINEVGGEAIRLGVVRDDEQLLREALEAANDCDIILLSGGTSKGEGDLCYRVVAELSNPGIVAHGVALKPGKPVCLAVGDGKPVVVLPGFPTSAVFTFHEFVAPVIRAFAGVRQPDRATIGARLARQVNSVRGRTEYLLVHLIEAYNAAPENDQSQLVAYPMGKGSGSVTAFSMADGFITIDQHTEIVEADAVLEVTLLSESLRPADLVFIGSHCQQVDSLISRLHLDGFAAKVLHVGSLAGLEAARRGECDVAGIHLLEPKTGEYNTAWLDERVKLIPGYTREQGLVFRGDDALFQMNHSFHQVLASVLADEDYIMVNRNRGSGTRIVVDEILGGAKPPGYSIETLSHNAVCASIRQGRADWGVAIRAVANQYELAFVPIRDERYDFVIPKRRERPALTRFLSLLAEHNEGGSDSSNSSGDVSQTGRN